MGQYNSSLTRVQPFFDELLDRDPTGHEWLGSILRAMPRSDQVPEQLLADPGAIDPSTLASSKGVRGCFEYRVPPSFSFLDWSIRNPDRLEWPKGRAGEFGAETAEWRRRLINGTPDERVQAMEEGLQALNDRGVEGSSQQPWAFEGWTSVDCCLETDRLIVFIEGKREEGLSVSTAWFPDRNQLVRNLEVIGQLRPEKAGFVLLLTEETAPDVPGREDVPASAPHLNSGQHDQLWARYLGQATWLELCDQVGIAFDSLPSKVTEPT